MKRISTEKMAINLDRVERSEEYWDDELKRQPRWKEALIFIQWKGMHGGIAALEKELLASQGDKLGSAVVCATGPGPVWSIEQCREVWEAMRKRVDSDRLREFAEFSEWGADKVFSNKSDPDWKDGARRFNRDYFIAEFRKIAGWTLANDLVDLCEARQHYPSVPWYFESLFGALACFMDEHAASAARVLADTSAKRKIVRRLDFARCTGTPVTIFGDTAAGKSACAKVVAGMYPGQWRYVALPAGDSERRFYEVQAEALDIDFTTTEPLHGLKSKVEAVIRAFGVGWIYDEAHFAIPSNYTAKTAPQRMNWIRCEVIDRGIVAAFLCTRQDFQRKLKKFVKETQYQFEQWIRRIAEPLVIEAKPTGEEIELVARQMFPALDSDVVALVADKCAGRGTGFQEIEPLMKYVIFVACQAGRAACPLLEDTDRAFLEYLNEDPAPPPPAAGDKPAKPSRGPRQALKISDDTQESEPEAATSRLITA